MKNINYCFSIGLLACASSLPLVNVAYAQEGQAHLCTNAELILANKNKLNAVLHEAIHQNNLILLQEAINCGASIDNRDNPKWLPLTWAARYGYLGIVNALITAGAGIDEGDDESPLMSAAGKGHLEIVKVLIEAGADVNKAAQINPKKPSYGTATPLSQSIMGGHFEVAKALIAARADVNKLGSFGWSPLFIAVFSCRSENQIEIINFLIEAGVDVNRRNINGETPLLAATLFSNLEVIKALITAGADVNQVFDNFSATMVQADLRGSNLLYATVGYAGNIALRLEILDTLIAAGIDVNQTNNDGNTPLHMAVERKGIESVNALLAAGADVKKANNKGFTPLSIARSKGYTEIAGALLAAEATANQDIPLQVSDFAGATDNFIIL